MLTTVPIPAWNSLGLLPPVDEAQPASTSRSPYPVALLDVAQRFATSPERRTVLSGLLRYRQALHAVGLIRGFQWLDGSFLEHIEVIEQRPPRDIDVVTFFHLPDGVTQRELASSNQLLFRPQHTKQLYSVDAYLVDLGMAAERLVIQSSYWYSMWSHRRNQAWKGYVQVDLANDQDEEAQAWLKRQGDTT